MIGAMREDEREQLREAVRADILEKLEAMARDAQPTEFVAQVQRLAEDARRRRDCVETLVLSDGDRRLCFEVIREVEAGDTVRLSMGREDVETLLAWFGRWLRRRAGTLPGA